MASAGRLFGAALLNALGKGAEGAAKGYEDARNYALKKATAEADLVPSSVKEEAYIAKLPIEKQQRIYDLKTASGGTKITVQPGGGIKKEGPPKEPTAAESKNVVVNTAVQELGKDGKISLKTRGLLGETAARDLERAHRRNNPPVPAK